MSKTAPQSVSKEHDDFPVSFADFAAKLKGTPDEVWTRVLRVSCGQQKNVYSVWREALASVKAS
jgi:hypothetical protein